MKRLFVFVMFVLVCFSCTTQEEKVDEGLRQVMTNFIDRYDFVGSYWEDDSCVSLITTCLSMMLYDIEGVHYMTLVCFQLPVDFFDDIVHSDIAHNPVCYFKLKRKDVFVFNHTKRKLPFPLPLSKHSVSDAIAMTKIYNEKEEPIFETIYKETYRYNVTQGKVSIQRDTVFDVFKWIVDKGQRGQSL